MPTELRLDRVSTSRARRLHARRLASLAALLAALGAGGCMEIVQGPNTPGSTGHAVTRGTPLLARAERCLVGSFSSAAQSKADSNFRSIDLHMAPIWNDRLDGPWLYVEQAVSEMPDRPYRQRVYRLQPGTGDGGVPVVYSFVYTLPGDPLAFAGAWKDVARFNSIDPGMLSILEGCTVTLRGEGAERLVGGTFGTGCVSTMNGATHTSSEVTLTPDWIETLDRGFDANGTQVWGSEHGAYRFVRVP
ncbi:MAG: chromophore lyase CpcT/CpeT [Phycisphaerales bacterium]|jgi:CpeT protein